MLAENSRETSVAVSGRLKTHSSSRLPTKKLFVSDLRPIMVTAQLAELIGPEGHIVGIDFSGAQIAQARVRLNGSGANASFLEASATDTGLPSESFDLIYSRFLLIHLAEPEQALREMRRLLKPDGILVCEDGDLTTSGSMEEVETRSSVKSNHERHYALLIFRPRFSLSCRFGPSPFDQMMS